MLPISMLEMEDHQQTLCIGEQRTIAEPVEELEEVTLDESRPGRTTRMGTLASPVVRQDLVNFLRMNQDIFAWSHEDMPGIDPSVIVHRLHVNPDSPPVRQKKRVFAQERDKSSCGRSKKTAGGGVYPRSLLPRLASKCGHGEKEQRKVENVRRLHGP